MVIESCTESSEDKITDSDLSEEREVKLKTMECLNLFSGSSEIQNSFQRKSVEFKKEETDSSELADSYDEEVNEKFKL